MIRTVPHSRRGVALIPALLILSIVASSAALLDLGQQIWIRQVENLRDRAQADELVFEALDAAMGVISVNRYGPATPEAMEAWSQQAPAPDVDGGAAEMSISSAEGLFNLNSLMAGGAPSVGDVAVFRRLLATAGLNPDLSDAVLDWIDVDDDRRPSGAESRDYLAQMNGYRAANRPFESVEELSLVRGFDAASIEKIRPYLSVMPETTPIDVNAAPAQILAALFKNPPADLAARLVASRAKSPFQNAFDFGIRAGMNPENPGAVVFKSRYFLVRADGRFGRARRRTESLVYCPPGFGAGRILWRSDVF